MELRELREDFGWKVELVEDGRSVSRLWIVDRQMRIGTCPVYTGGIAGVGTDPQYRRRGLARRVLQASLQLMEREGYEVSFLFGIQDFYDKFGFATCMPERRLFLDVRAAERARKQASMRPAREGDWPAIARLYNRDNAERTGSVWRDPGRWRGFPMGSGFGVEAGVRVVEDGRGRVAGYVVYDEVEERCRAAEVGGRGEGVFATILHFLSRRAIRLRREEVSLSMPVDHPFARYCRHFGCRDNTHFERNAGPMARLIDLGASLGKVLPELERRWGEEGRTQTLGLRTDIGEAALRWRAGGLTLGKKAGPGAARLSQEALMQLLMGYCTATDLVATGRLRAGARTLALLERLFPLQQAHMWWPDRF